MIELYPFSAPHRAECSICWSATVGLSIGLIISGISNPHLLIMASTNPKTYEPTSATRVAFLGLGVMGFPMAGHLALAGHQVTVYNRNSGKAQD